MIGTAIPVDFISVIFNYKSNKSGDELPLAA
jgi:hypothetical protein